MEPVTPPDHVLENDPNVRVVQFKAPDNVEEGEIEDITGVTYLGVYPEAICDTHPDKPYPHGSCSGPPREPTQQDIEDGNATIGPIAIEFMFALDENEVATLSRRPYLSIRFLSDHLHPFQIMTTFPEMKPDQRASLDHHHQCPMCATFWTCDDPFHKVKDSRRDRLMLCDGCLAGNVNGRGDWDKVGEDESDQSDGQEPGTAVG